jgi:predicted porin
MSLFKVRPIVLAALTATTALSVPPARALPENAPAPTAAAAPTPTAMPAAAAEGDSALTWAGITVYGTIDSGVAYLNHGAPFSDSYGPGLPFLIQKFSNHATVSTASNGLSQSILGISGLEHLTDDLFAEFKAETGFSPISGRLTDGPASLVKDDGKPVNQQTESGDSSRAGQLLQGPAYVGLGSHSLGTLTVGRQYSLMADDLTKYDPQQQSQAFSPIGYSGTSGGMGDTEDKILDSTVKYFGAWGPMRLAVLHQFGKDGELPAPSTQADVGADYGALSVDVLWSQINDAVNVTSLSVTQAATLPPGTLAGTVSNNSAWSVQASYDLKPVKFYSGWERIHYGNPDQPVAADTQTIGGYVISVVNNTAYTINRILIIDWLGVRYSVTPKLQLTGAYYQYHQDSYAKLTCSASSASSCSGNEYDASAVADYHFTRRFDTYLGVNWSEVQNGLSSGYLYKSDWAPMVGGRFRF